MTQLRPVLTHNRGKPIQIPKTLLRELNRGRKPTTHLLEWLAVDMGYLLCTVLPELGL